MAHLKLYLDEMIPIDLALILRQYGYNILTAKEAGMLSKSDSEQLEFSTYEERALLTFNISDFIKLHNYWLSQNRKHKGIIVSPEIKISALTKLSLRLLAVTSDGEIDNQLRFLQEFQ